jgi:hypothetical protein
MSPQASQEELILRSIARLRAGVLAIVCGGLGAVALFVATAWLLIRGGETVGPHLGLLGNYLPGYSVTWTGAAVGLLWGLLIGGLIGWATAWIYNLVAGRRATGLF